jgi:hypothetical protein
MTERKVLPRNAGALGHFAASNPGGLAATGGALLRFRPMASPNKSGGKDRPPQADTSRMQAADETAKALDALDAELAELKARHDQYFLGLERFEPIKDREGYKKRLNALKTSHIRNSGLKFRVQALWQKYLSYERMWLRIAREIEEGTYSRDLFKARMRGRKRDLRASTGDAPDAADAKDQPDNSIDEAELAGGLEEALAAASAAVAPKAKPEPKTDPNLQAAAAAQGKPVSAPVTARPPPPPPPPGATAAPAAAARVSGSFPALKGPPPPPAEARVKTTGEFPALKGPPPPPPSEGQPRNPVSVSAARPPPPPPPPAQPGEARPRNTGEFAAIAKPASAPAASRPVPPPPPTAASAKASPPTSSPSAARPPPPPPPAGARPPPPPGNRPATASGGAALPDDKMRAIYNAYVAAKRQCKEPTDGVTYEAVARTINTQMPEVMKSHNAKAVDFKVVIKNGKATLKAVPRT